MDVMGGASGGFSATCWYGFRLSELHNVITSETMTHHAHRYFGMELNKKLDIPIGLVHSSYGGSAVEDWISNETLNANGGATSPTNPCPGPVGSSMGLPSQQFNGQVHPLINMTLKGAIWCVYPRDVASVHSLT